MLQLVDVSGRAANPGGMLQRLKNVGVHQHSELEPNQHTWATRGETAGLYLVTLASMLGHSHLQMVLRYAHPTEEHQFLAMRKPEAFVANG